MAVLNRAPTPEQFANAWTRGFAAAVRTVARRNRLTEEQAERIGVDHPEQLIYRDNALNYLRSIGRHSVKVDKIISAGHRYALGQGESAVGPSGRISLVGAQAMAEDIGGDFRVLRGRTPLQNDLATRLAEVTNGLIFPSSDGARGNIKPFYSEMPSAGDITPATLRDAIGNRWTELGERIWGEAPLSVNFSVLTDLANLADQQYSQAATDQFVADMRADRSESDNNAMLDLLTQELGPLTVIRFGEPNADGRLSDSGDFGLFLVGKTRDDHIAGIFTGQYID